MNLIKIFAKEQLLDTKKLTPGYEDNSSDVWLVKTDKREVIIRASKDDDVDGSIFWGCCNKIFGINPVYASNMLYVNNNLAGQSGIYFPKIIEIGYDEREYAIVEKLDGEMLTSFKDLSFDAIFRFGKDMALIHQKSFDYIGNPAGSFVVTPENYTKHLADSMDFLVEKYYSEDEKISSALPAMRRAVLDINQPEYCSYVMVDLDPTQFFTDGKYITAAVDTEAYVIAPRELDFIALEYVLDKRTADAFRKGYESVMPVPCLSICRIPYRYLYRLIEIQDDEDLDDWMKYPELF